MAEKIKILFLGASPADRHPRRVGEEMREIEQAIREAKLRDDFILETQTAVRPSDLQRALLRFEPNVVHFSGFGSPQAEIILEDEDGASRPVSQTALRDLFRILGDSVRIVVLNACHSQAQAQALNEIIDYAIGTSQVMQESAAVAFAAAP